ncbi:MAG: tetratricopeptide repeat protein [bacterium]|nr:tetratricopeptide repeat protein [bacterium]
MAKRPDSKQATETLEEIESVFDRLAEWVSSNPRIVLGVLGGILGVAGIVGLGQSFSLRSEQKGSEELAAIYADYLSAMGATPGALEVEEPANREVGQRARTEYAAKLLAGADEHGGTLAAVGARIQAGVLQAESGELDAALATWREAADEAPAPSSIRSLALLRLGGGLEKSGDFPGAAAAYAQAADNPSFPARFLALASAARCWLEVGDREQAKALYLQLEATEPPAGSIPEHVKSRLEELKGEGGAS